MRCRHRDVIIITRYSSTRPRRHNRIKDRTIGYQYHCLRPPMRHGRDSDRGHGKQLTQGGGGNRCGTVEGGAPIRRQWQDTPKERYVLAVHSHWHCRYIRGSTKEPPGGRIETNTGTLMPIICRMTVWHWSNREWVESRCRITATATALKQIFCSNLCLCFYIHLRCNICCRSSPFSSASSLQRTSMDCKTAAVSVP